MALLLVGALIAFGCAEDRGDLDIGQDTLGTDTVDAGQETAMAELQPTEGNNASGTVTFTQVNDGVRVEANVRGVEPGSHGFHVHEEGDCSAPDAESAGEHFAGQGMQQGGQPGAQQDTLPGAEQDAQPGTGQAGTQHGGPDSPQRHAGDLGNIEVGPDSTGTYSRVDNVISLTGPNSIVGRSVILHADEDDLTTQPSGNAGERIACGEIMSGNGGMGMPGTTPGPGTGAPTDTGAVRNTPGSR